MWDNVGDGMPSRKRLDLRVEFKIRPPKTYRIIWEEYFSPSFLMIQIDEAVD